MTLARRVRDRPHGAYVLHIDPTPGPELPRTEALQKRVEARIVSFLYEDLESFFDLNQELSLPTPLETLEKRCRGVVFIPCALASLTPFPENVV